MGHYVTHRNGNRLYINNPPESLEGYERDAENPFFFRVVYPPCRFRIKRKCGTCSKAREDYYCVKLKLDKYLPCFTCEFRDASSNPEGK